MTFVIPSVLPLVLGYFVLAVLAIVPQTYALRVALWPIVTLFALRAASSVDMSPGDPDRKSRNALFVFSMILLIGRTFDWTLMKEPLVRSLRPAKGSKSTIMDALDLATTLRGHGWDWSCGVYIPPETRPTNRRGFTIHVVLSAALHALICVISRTVIQSFSPTGLGAPSGGSIFDETLPFYVRYIRSSLISLFGMIAMYAVIQTCYDTCTTVGVLVFQQDPARWPPAFDAPWRATSLCDLWGRRWHQFFRHMFLMHGGYPLSTFLGIPGLIIGTFVSSGVYHHIATALLNDGLEPWRLLVGFGMMAPGIFAERMFKRLTGKKVGGVVGWAWTMAWLCLWGNLITDALGRGGVCGHFTFIERMVPGREVVQRLISNFDAWLHTL